MHPEDREFVAEKIRKMFAAHRGFDFTKRIVRPDGEIRRIRCVGVPATHGETFQGFVGTGMDVTEHEQLTQELQRREAYLVEAQRLSRTGSFGWSIATGEIFWSDETYQIFEYDRGRKPTVERVLERVHPEDRAKVQEQIERATRDGKDIFIGNIVSSCPDGSVKHVHVVAHAIKDESGTTEFVGAVMDVTTAKQVEEKIRQQEMELRQILDLTPQHIGVFGPDGSPLYGNHVAREYFGVDIDRLLTESRIDLFHPDDRERFLAERKKGILEGDPGVPVRRDEYLSRRQKKVMRSGVPDRHLARARPARNLRLRGGGDERMPHLNGLDSRVLTCACGCPGVRCARGQLGWCARSSNPWAGGYSYSIRLITFAGAPAATENGSMSWVTTLFAPITQRSPIVTPLVTTTLAAEPAVVADPRRPLGLEPLPR